VNYGNLLLILYFGTIILLGLQLLPRLELFKVPSGFCKTEALSGAVRIHTHTHTHTHTRTVQYFAVRSYDFHAGRHYKTISNLELKTCPLATVHSCTYFPKRSLIFCKLHLIWCIFNADFDYKFIVAKLTALHIGHCIVPEACLPPVFLNIYRTKNYFQLKFLYGLFYSQSIY
jgi:hypothetical protein